MIMSNNQTQTHTKEMSLRDTLIEFYGKYTAEQLSIKLKTNGTFQWSLYF